jgi:hypothetical protein
VAWIQSQADQDGLPAILAGDWRSTTAQPAANLDPLSPEVIALFDQSLEKGGPFTRAAPAGFTPSCDYCTSTDPTNPNPYNTDSTPYELLQTFTYDFPASSGVSDTLWGTGNDVPLHGSQYEPPPASGVGPLSNLFPHNVVIRRPK